MHECTCLDWPEVGRGLMVAESTSPVGKGMAGLLLINGMPPPASGTKDGTVTGAVAPWLNGAGPGETASWRGRKGQGYAGEDETTPPETGAGASIGGCCGEMVLAFWGNETSMASF